MKTEMEILALQAILTRLVSTLDAQGLISKKEFAAGLRSEAQRAEETAPPRLRMVERHDLALLRTMADAMDESSLPSWTPTVIQGGADPEGE